MCSARPQPVGTTLLSSDEASAAGMKGKGLRILHAYGDMLWESGPKIVPAGFEKDHVASVIASGHIAEALNHAAPCEPEATAAGAAETRSTDASTAHVRIARHPPLALRGLYRRLLLLYFGCASSCRAHRPTPTATPMERDLMCQPHHIRWRVPEPKPIRTRC